MIFIKSVRTSLVYLGTLFTLICVSSCSAPVGQGKVPNKTEISSPPVSGDSAIGREEGGGGYTLLSSQDEVRNAIGKAWKYSLHPNAGSNPLQRFANWYLKNEKNEKITTIIKHMFLLNEENFELKQYKYFWEYLKRSGQPITDLNSCSGGGKNHTDGSVSHNLIGATICLNVSSLQKIPKYSLINEILGLIIHEMAHINGYNESDAHAIQSAAATYFARIASGMAADENREFIMNHIAQARLELTTIFRDKEIDPRKTFITQSLRSTILLLNQIPIFKDEIGLEIGLNVSRPIVCNNALEKVKVIEKKLALLLARGKPDEIEYIETREDFPDGSAAFGTKEIVKKDYPVKILNPHEWSTSRKTIIDSIEQLEEVEAELTTCFNEKN